MKITRDGERRDLSPAIQPPSGSTMITYLYMLIFGLLWFIGAFGIRQPRVGGLLAAVILAVPIIYLSVVSLIKRAPDPLESLGTQLADRRQHRIFLTIATAWLVFGLIGGGLVLTGRALTDDWWDLQAPWVRSVFGVGMLWCSVGGWECCTGHEREARKTKLSASDRSTVQFLRNRGTSRRGWLFRFTPR